VCVCVCVCVCVSVSDGGVTEGTATDQVRYQCFCWGAAAAHHLLHRRVGLLHSGWMLTLGYFQQPTVPLPSVPVPSVLWCWWLGGRKGIWSVKKLSGEVLAWLSVWSEMPLPLTVSCSSKIEIGFTFLVPAHPGSPGQRAVKRICVCYL